jgi:hypothetical protein
MAALFPPIPPHAPPPQDAEERFVFKILRVAPGIRIADDDDIVENFQ